jgi:hypothetical protein
MITYTIYENPTDYPGKFVLKRFTVKDFNPVPDKQPIAVVDDLEAARAELPEGLINYGRHEKDEKQIVETWI